MAKVIKTTFKLRRGKEAAWEKNNPVLAAGEPRWEHCIKLNEILNYIYVEETK